MHIPIKYFYIYFESIFSNKKQNKKMEQDIRLGGELVENVGPVVLLYHF